MINCIISTIGKDRVNDRTGPATWALISGEIKAGLPGAGYSLQRKFLWFDQCDVVIFLKNGVEQL